VSIHSIVALIRVRDKVEQTGGATCLLIDRYLSLAMENIIVCE